MYKNTNKKKAIVLGGSEGLDSYQIYAMKYLKEIVG